MPAGPRAAEADEDATPAPAPALEPDGSEVTTAVGAEGGDVEPRPMVNEGEPLPEGASVAESAALAAEQMAALETEQDEAEAAEDDALNAAVAAAAAEIDAFLQEAGIQMTQMTTRSNDAAPTVGSDAVSPATKAEIVEKEKAVGTAMLQYDRAKGALGALSERMEAVQRELDHLGDEHANVMGRVVEMGGPGEPSVGAAAMGRVTNEEMATIPRRRNLEREAGQYAAQIAAQTAELQTLQPKVNAARRELIGAENEMALIGQMRAEVAAVGEGEYRLNSRKAARSNAKDAKTVERYADAKRDAETRAQVRREMAREADEAVITSAIEARRSAIRRAAEGLAIVRENLRMCELEDRESHQRDVRRLLELKKSTEEALEGITKFVAAKQSAHKAKKLAQREEAVGLLAKGINPHTVFRERDEKRRVRRTTRVNKETHEARVAEIRQKLAREEALYQKEKALKNKEREKAEYFAKVTGKTAVEGRVKKYMEKSIRDGRDVLDPTGRRPVYPGAVSTAKPVHFGLGLNDDPELTEIVAERHPGTKPTSLLMTEKEKQLRGTHPGGAGTLGRSAARTMASTGKSDVTFANPTAAKAEDGLGLEESEAGSDEEEDFDASERRAKKKTMDAREATRLQEKAKQNFARPGRLYTSQKVCGREFSGDSFIPTPKKIVFRDFEVGRKYKQRCTLTNVSYSFNTFKVLDIEPEFRGFFDVEYEFPGKLSAGMSSDVFLTFTPKVANAISTTLPVSTNTGIVHVPLECFPKSADVFTPTPILDFATVTLGDTPTMMGELQNVEAIPVPFTVLASRPRNPDAPPSQFTVRVKGTTAKEGTESREGIVPGYGSAFLAVKFAPSEEGGVDEDIVVRLGAPLHRDVVISLRGVGGPVPVHLDGRVDVDFKAVALGCAYRDALVVHNRGSSASKCLVKVPHELRGCVEVIPDMVFVQAKSSAVFSIKMAPNAETAERCARHVNPETGALEVPMRVQVPDQAVPVNFTLKALLTTSDIVFNPPKVDFGEVFLGETSVVKLEMTNRSLLMQQYGFVGLPQTVTVRPSPFGEIMSNETVKIELSYAPRLVTFADFHITLKSLLGGRTFHVPCKAVGVKPTLQLSANVITLPATAEREKSSGSVIVKNKSKQRETFEIVVPEEGRKVLKVSPHVGVLEPGEGVRVQVDFCPETKPRVQPELAAEGKAEGGEEAEVGEMEGAEATPPAEGDADAGAEAGDGDGEVTGTVRFKEQEHERPSTAPSEPEPQCDVFRLPMYIKATAGAIALPAGGDDEAVGHGTQIQHLEVRTVTHASAIVVTNLEELPDAKEVTYVLDFGPIAVGEQRVRAVMLRNLSDQSVSISSSAPDHEGVFSSITAFRPIEPHGTFMCKLNFTPNAVGKFFELITISTSLRTVRVALSGVGISPTLGVEPADVVDVGDTIPGGVSHTSVTVTNPTQFALKYKVDLRGVIAPGSTSRCPFVCSPSGGVIPPEGAAEVTVSFSPDRTGAYGVARQFTGELVVTVPGLDAETTRPLRSRCWAHGVYIVGGDEAAAGAGATGVAATARFLPSVDPLREPPGASPPFETLTLTLPQKVRPGETASGTLEVGSVKGADGAGANGEWSFEDFDEASKRRGWSMDSAKGTVEPGSRKPVVFTFAPPAEVRPGELSYFGLEEWIEATLVCKLKGGSPAPEEAEGREVRVTVRCFLAPQMDQKDAAEGAAGEAAAAPEE